MDPHCQVRIFHRQLELHPGESQAFVKSGQAAIPRMIAVVPGLSYNNIVPYDFEVQFAQAATQTYRMLITRSKALDLLPKSVEEHPKIGIKRIKGRMIAKRTDMQAPTTTLFDEVPYKLVNPTGWSYAAAADYNINLMCEARPNQAREVIRLPLAPEAQAPSQAGPNIEGAYEANDDVEDDHEVEYDEGYDEEESDEENDEEEYGPKEYDPKEYEEHSGKAKGKGKAPGYPTASGWTAVNYVPPPPAIDQERRDGDNHPIQGGEADDNSQMQAPATDERRQALRDLWN